MYSLIFEDYLSTPSSRLLLRCYNKDNIYFSDGKSSLRYKVRDLINAGKLDIVVFLDVNPLNLDTIEQYNSLRDMKEFNDNWKNVIIVPIICIEYHIADVCKKNNYFNSKVMRRPAVEYLVGKFEYDKITNPIALNSSLEQIYKRIFETYEPILQKCIVNANTSKSGIGIFYLGDCKCKDCSSCGISLSLKAEQLYTNLPVFDIIDDKHVEFLNSLGIFVNEISLEDLQNERQEFYDMICSKVERDYIVIDTIV